MLQREQRAHHLEQRLLRLLEVDRPEFLANGAGCQVPQLHCSVCVLKRQRPTGASSETQEAALAEDKEEESQGGRGGGEGEGGGGEEGRGGDLGQDVVAVVEDGVVDQRRNAGDSGGGRGDEGRPRLGPLEGHGSPRRGLRRGRGCTSTAKHSTAQHRNVTSHQVRHSRITELNKGGILMDRSRSQTPWSLDKSSAQTKRESFGREEEVPGARVLTLLGSVAGLRGHRDLPAVGVARGGPDPEVPAGHGAAAGEERLLRGHRQHGAALPQHEGAGARRQARPEDRAVPGARVNVPEAVCCPQAPDAVRVEPKHLHTAAAVLQWSEMCREGGR